MVKATMEIRAKAVILSEEGVYKGKEIGQMYNISERTLRRWRASYRRGGIEELKPRVPGPRPSPRIPKAVEQRILSLKRQYPHWGARRLKHQFNLSVHWKTVHNVIKRHGLLIRVKAKPQPCKRFQRHHVDSMWQGDTFQFRIRDVGKVYVTGFTDDCSRYRVRSKAYLKKDAPAAVNALQWALRKGRAPQEIYLDNGKQFVAKVFKAEAKRFGIKLIFGRPYHPRGRGKIESYHKTLYRELITLKEFKSLSHFRRELRNFDQRYNDWRKQEILGWQTPASRYFNEKYFNKARRTVQKADTNSCTTSGQ